MFLWEVVIDEYKGKEMVILWIFTCLLYDGFQVGGQK